MVKLVQVSNKLSSIELSRRIKQVDEAENNKTTFSPWTSNSVNANTGEDIIQYGLLSLHPVKGYTIVAKDG